MAKRKAANSKKFRRDNPPTAAAQSCEAWTFLNEQFPKKSALAREAVYSLSPRLIQLIENNVPGFFEPHDVAFERELATASAVGFFRQAPIDCPILLPDGDSSFSVDQQDAKTAQAVQNIKSMLAEGLVEKGASQQTVESYFDEIGQERESVRELQLGYAGWLATSREFVADRERLRKLVTADLTQQALPAFPRNVFPGLHVDLSDEFINVWRPFYKKWSVDRLATWELPVPMTPEITTPSLYPIEQMDGAGLLVFLPWHLLRARGRDLLSLSKNHQLLEVAPPLREWLQGTDGRWGPRRYGTLTRLYVYLELALKARYRTRMRKRVETFDRIFAELLSSRGGRNSAACEGETSDSIKKIRQHMNARLKKL